MVMAGNLHTESGEKFKIPDMLSNRADTYNLGDVVGATQPPLRRVISRTLSLPTRYCSSFQIRAKKIFRRSSRLAKQARGMP